MAMFCQRGEDRDRRPAGTTPCRRAPSSSRSPRWATAPLIPAPATLAKYASAVRSVPGRKVARPASIGARPAAPARRRPQPRACAGCRRLRTKSLPVPRGSIASSTSSRARPSSRSRPRSPCRRRRRRRAARRRRRPPPARQLGEVAGRLGDERVARSAERRRPALASSGQRRPVDAVRRRRVDEEDGAANGLAVAVASATRVIRSTAARSSSSEMRLNSPSTTMSLTVSRQPAWTPRSAPTREQRRGLHLDREDAALRPALVLALVRVVEEVARDDRADVHRLAHLLRGVDGAVDQLPARGRAVRLVRDEVHRGRVGGHGGERDDQVAERVVGLQARRRCRRGAAS